METLGTVFGSFSKGCEGSIALNFSQSGAGGFCSRRCSLYDHCYATTIEGFKPSVAVNGGRHQRNVGRFLDAILNGIDKLASAPWIRISAFGSVPAKPSETESARFAQLAAALDHSRVHFPVETIAKAKVYRGLGFRPRISCQDRGWRAAKRALAAGFPVSMVVNPDRFEPGWQKRAIDAARDYARHLRQDCGTPCKVCPAIQGNAKCGQCKLCASPLAVVIYPRHP